MPRTPTSTTSAIASAMQADNAATEQRDCAMANPHEPHEWVWDGATMRCAGRPAARTDRLVAGDDHGASAESGTPQSPATSAAYARLFDAAEEVVFAWANGAPLERRLGDLTDAVAEIVGPRIAPSSEVGSLPDTQEGSNGGHDA